MLCSPPSRRLGAEPPAHVVRRMRMNFEVVLRRSTITTGRNQAAGTRQPGTCARRSDYTEASSTRLGASVDPTEARNGPGPRNLLV